MFNPPFQHVRDRLDSPVRVPREAGKVIRRIVSCPEIIEHQERIETREFPEAECTVEPDAGSLDRRIRPEYLSYLTNLCHNWTIATGTYESFAGKNLRYGMFYASLTPRD
jgi:hypothetical protein